MSDNRQPTPLFDHYADQYEAALDKGLSLSGEGRDFFARGRVAWLARCLERMDQRGGRILDFGCGTGATTPVLLEQLKADEVVGVDMSSRSLEVARSAHASDRVRFVLMDDFKPSADLDLAFCNGVFHHVPPPERPGVARWILDCLRPGGLFALWDNNPWNPGARLVMRRIPFDREAVMLSAREARDLLQAAGFDLIRTDYLFVFPRVLKGLRHLERFVARWPFGAQYQVLARKPAGGMPTSVARASGRGFVEWVHEHYVRGRRARVLSSRLAGLMPPNALVLDVGCGDGCLAQTMALLRPDIRIEGIDVVVRPDTRISVRPFNGGVIPHPDRSFDTVLLIDVLHHTTDPAGLLREAVRVARRSVIVKDVLSENAFDTYTLTFMDRVGNERYGVPLPFNYLSRKKWMSLLGEIGVEVESWIGRIGQYPPPASWFFERSLHFIAVLQPRAASTCES